MRYTLKVFKWSSHQVIADLLRELDGQTILDVGCGEGFLGRSLEYRPRKLVGIDKGAVSHPKNYTVVWQANIERDSLHFLDRESFDVIVFADVLEHLNQPLKILDVLQRNLRADGFIIICVPNMGFWLARLLLFLRIRPRMSRGLFDSSHRHDFEFRSIRELIKRTSLKLVKTVVVPVPLPLLSWLFDRGMPLHGIYRLVNLLAQRFPASWAYQIILLIKK